MEKQKGYISMELRLDQLREIVQILDLSRKVPSFDEYISSSTKLLAGELAMPQGAVPARTTDIRRIPVDEAGREALKKKGYTDKVIEEVTFDWRDLADMIARKEFEERGKSGAQRT